ncbi:MAG: hypothetical protein MJ077_03060 [Oscillospiraceae bacterium]|nr:hypothetical protein [Oscillospiraceae bacterium]
MIHTLPLTENGISCGVVEYREEGCYLVFTIDAPPWGNGLKKVWLTSEQGARMLLGTLQPDQHRLRLCRKISRSALRCCGLDAPCGALVNPGAVAAPRPSALPEGWHPMEALPMEDKALCQLLQQAQGGMWQEQGDQVRIRYPWKPGKAVPVMPLFRFGSRNGAWWEIRLHRG